MENANSARIISAIKNVRAPAMPGEYDIHAMISDALSAAEISHEHEYRLGPRCRLDFMCGNIAVEIKKGKPQRAELMKQLSRYMQSPEVEEMVVVVQKRVSLPETLCGKRLHMISLNMLWGVALP